MRMSGKVNDRSVHLNIEIDSIGHSFSRSFFPISNRRNGSSDRQTSTTKHRMSSKFIEKKIRQK